jgi:hypothetical protein
MSPRWCSERWACRRRPSYPMHARTSSSASCLGSPRSVLVRLRRRRLTKCFIGRLTPPPARSRGQSSASSAAERHR